MAKVIQVIETTVNRGKGVEGDPIRGVMQYWSLDGEMLAEVDPLAAGVKANEWSDAKREYAKRVIAGGPHDA